MVNSDVFVFYSFQIQDYLEGKVGLNEYHQRKLLCDELSTRLSHSQSQQTMLASSDALAPQQVLQNNSKTGTFLIVGILSVYRFHA